MIKKILIANRGEIACRIIHTANKMGIATLAVYSEVDQNAMHAQMADESICIGPAPSIKSYLNIDKIINVALAHQVDAIHPGYGFLSENATFAKQVEEAGLVFIGAPASAISAMGSKAQARKIMEQAGVPLVPGFDNPKADKDEIALAAKNIGFPLLIKASAGGGGKGMRVVFDHSQLAEAIESAQREAQNAFGDAHIILEKYIEQSRHVEVQVFFDQQGNGVYLFDRDCSLQRRYQKVVEEAPAPNLTPETHKKLGETALKAAQTTNYVGAGTIEFLVDKEQNFYFMEMNTRLQVEHPVTEMITHTDLVEWQIRIANGEPLPLKQEELSIQGHAVEVRLYAEEPHKNFLPATGDIANLRWPSSDQPTYLRIETGVQTGDSISPWYDPMIAKIVTWAQTREQSIERMIHALQETYITGLPVNRDFLIKLINQPDFIKGKLSTAFIEKNYDLLLSQNTDSLHSALLAVTWFIHHLNTQNNTFNGWRVNLGKTFQKVWEVNDNKYFVKIEQYGISLRAMINQQTVIVDNILLKDSADIDQTESCQKVQVHFQENCHTWRLFILDKKVTAISTQDTFTFSIPLYDAISLEKESLCAPMNGIVSKVNINAGDTVIEGDILVIIEAMKMEISIKAPKSGEIDTVYFQTGDAVKEGDILLSFKDEEER